MRAARLLPLALLAAVCGCGEPITIGMGGAGGGAGAGGMEVTTQGMWMPSATQGTPGGRTHHSAAWTGSEMIVWGGFVPIGPLKSGARYDPQTDAWTPMASQGGPSARGLASLFWTGSEILVWGGEGAGGPISAGGRWDPATDTWKRMSARDAPAPTTGYAAVWTGSELVLWGGRPAPQMPSVATGARYDPVADKWRELGAAGAPSARFKHSAVWTGSEMVVWGGGDSQSPDGTNTGGRWDPATDAWLPLAIDLAPPARVQHTAVFCGGSMVIWGGAYATRSFSSGGRWDPATDTWTPVSRRLIPPPKTDHTAVCAGDKMIVWGGLDVPRHLESDVGGLYDLATDAWTITTRSGSPSPRRHHSAIWTGSEMIVWGGIRVGEAVSSAVGGGRFQP